MKSALNVSLATYLHTFFCIVTVLFSTALLAVAGIVRELLSSYDDFLFYYGTVITTYIFAGYTCTILSTLPGSYAFYVRRRKLMVAFLISQMAALALQITVTFLYVITMDKQFFESIEIFLDSQRNQYGSNPHPIDNLQINLTCCGKEDAKDWDEILTYIPSSCCPRRSPQVNSTECRILEDFFIIQTAGCLQKLQRMPMFSMNVICGLSLGVMVTEVITIGLEFYILASSMSMVQSVKQSTPITSESNYESA
ncbi:CD63 antigen isoform X2 [Anabrus simplex]|uniref:CD63 antigen isoform X2 n=1 Tax=Anabrus simplex TaxID=316456 RepID=UPI0034DD7A73